MMPGQIPDPSLTAGALPGLGPLTGLPGTALTAEELKCADIRNIGAMISPLQFLEVKLGKRPQPVKSEVSVGDCWLQVAPQGCCLHLLGLPSCPCLAVVAGWPAVCFIGSCLVLCMHVGSCSTSCLFSLPDFLSLAGRSLRVPDLTGPMQQLTAI